MNMHDYALQEMKRREKQIIHDNQQLDAFRKIIAADIETLKAWNTIVKSYATTEYPGTKKMNVIILECINRSGGKASRQQIVACIEAHQITLPRNKLSQLLAMHEKIKYDKQQKLWRVKEPANESA